MKLRLSLVFLFLALPVPPAQAETKPAVTAPPISVLAADNQKTMNHILIHFADFDIIPTLFTLLNNLPATTRVSIATSFGEKAQLARIMVTGWKIPSPDRIEVIGLPKAIDYWVRDEFVVAENQTYILPERFKAKKIPLSLQEVLRTHPGKVIHSNLKFDGGNIVTSEDTVFVGYNLVLQNLGENFRAPEDLTHYIGHLFGKKVVVVGGPDAPIPHEHIDMFLTPLNLPKPTLLVGSPRLATRCLKRDQALQRPYGRVYFDPQRVPMPNEVKKLLFATKDFMERVQNDLGNQGDTDITLPALYAKNSLPAVQAAYDRIADQMSKKGFKVFRVPLLTNHDLAHSPFITYNNMLMEVTAAGKNRAYLPNYNIVGLDQEAKVLLETLGYEVVAIDVQNIAFFDGTLRCITQVLKREVQP